MASSSVVSARRSSVSGVEFSTGSVSSRRGSMEPSEGSMRKSILKKESFIDIRDDLERAARSFASESPEQWFQRVLRDNQLSPLDLCDRFCYGDARKHRHVPLKLVCESLFELDPGNDPLSEAMEEFLYRFSFDPGDGEIVIDIKEALRTLDIWKTTAPSPSKRDSTGNLSPQAAVSPAKAAVLQVKAEKLKSVISSLQEENLRLSRALSDTANSKAEDERPPSPLKIAIKKPLSQDPQRRSSFVNVSSVKEKTRQRAKPAVVSAHEEALVTLANRLEYGGVKRLEELVQKSDPTATGFVSLKQLRWLLANECGVDDISETQLTELCLGMNFNAQAQLDHKEFVRVLLDILLYESRPPSPPSKNHKTETQSRSDGNDPLTTKVREYLSGFHGSHEKTRELLEALCDKYDLEGNRCISHAEMTRVLANDLPHQHPYKLKFPLTHSEIKTLLTSIAQPPPRGQSPPRLRARASEFVYYPSAVDMLYAQGSFPSRANTDVLTSRVLQPDFWQALRSALCPREDVNIERKIHAQLCKILMKLDPKQSFVIAQRHFVRVFDQHWSSNDLETLTKGLSAPSRGRQGTGDKHVRYDVLMKLLFGAPELRDARYLADIVAKLQPTSRSWRDELMGMSQAGRKAPGTRLSYMQTYELLCQQLAPVSVAEVLYLIAHCESDRDHRVDTAKLWMALTTETKPSLSGSPPSESAFSTRFSFLRRCLRLLCDDHDLERTLERRARHEKGVARVDDLAEELTAQLRVLKLSPQDKEALRDEVVRGFIQAVASHDEAHSPGAGLLYMSALLDAIFDWDGMISALKLPDNLVQVKKTMELCDWDRDGCIEGDDWVKAWRQLTVNASRQRTASAFSDWELRVLVKRFPAAASDKRPRRSVNSGGGAIDYSKLLVYLLERQQRVAHELLQDAVFRLLTRLCERVTQGKSRMTTFHLEQAFEQIDRERKGYFHTGDLCEFVTDELQNSREFEEKKALIQYATQGTAMESVMARLVGEKMHKGAKKSVVSLMRFQELVNHGFFQDSGRRRIHPTTGDEDTTGDYGERQSRSRQSVDGQITLLRDLEQFVVEVCSHFVDSQGQISPTLAYSHLNGVAASSDSHLHRRPRSQSPLRSSSSSSISSTSFRRSSCSTPRPPTAENATGSRMDPLTASKLKHTLRQLHRVETSTHLIGQFFLHVGSSSRHFLELPAFAQWLAPLSVDLQSRVKVIVREMLVKSKSGGGQVDLDRFLGALSRRLRDAQATEAAMARATGRQLHDQQIVTVRPDVLLSRLHQLNVPLRKPEMAQLLRYFGMETPPEIDYCLFIRRLYELAQRLP